MEIVVTGDCVFYVKDLVPKDLCRTVIENYERDPRRRPGRTVGSRGEARSYDDVKVSTDLGIDNEGAWTAIHEQLHQAVSLVVASIAAQFPSLQVWPLRRTEIPRSEDKYVVSSFFCFDIPAAEPES